MDYWGSWIKKELATKKSVHTFFIPGMICASWAYCDQLLALDAHFINLNDPKLYPNIKETSIHSMALTIFKEIEAKSDGESIALIGHSMGGYLIFELLRIMREKNFNFARLFGLGIIGSGLENDSIERKKQRFSQINLINHGHFDQLVDLLIKSWFSENFKYNNHKILDNVKNELLGSRKIYEHVFCSQSYAAMSRADYLAEGDIECLPTCPIFFLWGEKDLLFNGSLIQTEIHRCSPKVVTQLIREAGHMVTVERAKDVSNLLITTMMFP